MIELVPNAAFRGLNRALGLAGARNLGAIDLAVASPVVDLREIMRAGLASRYLMRRAVTIAGAGAAQTTLNPYDPASWTAILRDGQTLTTPFAQALPTTHEYLITQVGATFSAGANQVVFAWFSATGANVYSPFWRGTTKITGRNDLYPDLEALPVFGTPLDAPALIPAAAYDLGAAGTLQLLLSLFAAPPGILSVA